MTSFHSKKQAGFIGLALLIVIGIGVLWYFGLDAQGFVKDHPGLREAGTFLYYLLETMWENYFHEWWLVFWHYVIVGSQFIAGVVKKFIP